MLAAKPQVLMTSLLENQIAVAVVAAVKHVRLKIQCGVKSPADFCLSLVLNFLCLSVTDF
jgi:hypothetical protein